MTAIIVAEGPSFRIVDEAAEQTVTARRQAKEEQEANEEQTQADAVVANKTSKVYYPHGCGPDKEIKETDRVVFGTKEEAEQAGYKVAKSCPKN